MPTLVADPRGHRELVHSGEVPAESLPAAGWPDGASARVLSRNPVTWAFSALLRLPKGWRRPAGWLAADTEWFVLSGWLWVGGELRSYGYFDWAPAGSAQEELCVMEEAEILFLPRTGAPDFTAGPAPGGNRGTIRIATEETPWLRPQTRNAPAHGRSKYMRRDPETGAMSALVWSPPGSSHPVLEFHDTVEEMFQIVGDISLANSGRMETGSYFWRPPYITHGPFASERGGIMYLYSDGKLVNFFPPDPGCTPEQNVLQAQRDREEATDG